MPDQYDAIIIGTGQAGPALANRLNAAGMRVAVAERNRIGGTCVNNGCIPTKALVASARAAYMARRGEDFGVRILGPVEVDMARLTERSFGWDRVAVAAWRVFVPCRRRPSLASGAFARRTRDAAHRSWSSAS